MSAKSIFAYLYVQYHDLEIVSDLSVESFLLAFRRFNGCQSVPKPLISDNGSTYLTAADDLEFILI